MLTSLRNFLLFLALATVMVPAAPGPVIQTGPRLFVEAAAVDPGAIRILGSGGSGDQARGVLSTLPTNWCNTECVLEIWLRPTEGITVASTSAVKVNRWSSDNVTPYSAADWWYLNNFVIDGHENGTVYGGTYSLTVANSGVLRWLVGDGAAADARTGDLHAAQGTTSILDGAWHQVYLVMRNSGGSSRDFELWLDNSLEDTETSTSRTAMGDTYWDGGFPGYTAGQDNWFFGAEKFSALGGAEWEHYMGLIDGVRFYNCAPASGELTAGVITSCATVAAYEFMEGSGTTVADEDAGASMSLVDADQYEWVTDDGI